MILQYNWFKRYWFSLTNRNHAKYLLPYETKLRGFWFCTLLVIINRVLFQGSLIWYLFKWHLLRDKRVRSFKDNKKRAETDKYPSQVKLRCLEGYRLTEADCLGRPLEENATKEQLELPEGTNVLTLRLCWAAQSKLLDWIWGVKHYGLVLHCDMDYNRMQARSEVFAGAFSLARSTQDCYLTLLSITSHNH